jgi:hypothetical protein
MSQEFCSVCFSTHFSFSFAFFVHGESTVCASMDVRMHPLVRNLTQQHLLQAQASSSGIPGLLYIQNRGQELCNNFTLVPPDKVGG